MENKYYVYFLLDPRNFYLPFYIGKGSGDRCYSHYEETRLTCYNLYKFNKIQKLKSLGFEPKILIFADNLTSQEAYDIEKQQILRFGRINFEDYGILVNISPGGNCGPILSGDKNPFYGKKHTEESRRKISEATKGKKISDKQKQQISDVHKGRPKSEETRKNMSAAAKGRPKSDEHRKKIGDAHRGKKISDKQKQQISDFQKGRKKTSETKEKMRRAAILREAKIKANRKIGECPHCKRVNEINPSFNRHHFDNCKMKDKHADI